MNVTIDIGYFLRVLLLFLLIEAVEYVLTGNEISLFLQSVIVSLILINKK